MINSLPIPFGVLTATAAALEDIRLASDIDACVLLRSTSRERRRVWAETIHLASRRADGPFVACSANHATRWGRRSPPVSEESLDHDVSLHVLFERARRGTLFIDDVADLSADSQSVLLALLEERAFGRAPGESAARVIAGSDGRFADARARGAFCAALFYRLNVMHIDVGETDPGCAEC
jgi:DNA-binding NtrC family response regulator